MDRRVVVTGLGAVTPCGNDVGTTWSAMRDAVSGIGRVTRFDVTDLPCQLAGEVKGFDPAAILGRKLARRNGQFMQYAMVAGDEAMRDAGLWSGEGPAMDPVRLGVYCASGIGGFPEIVEGAYQVRDEGIRQGVSPLFVARSLINLAAGKLTIRYTARGPSLCIATACAAGNHAIGEAWRTIKWGDADVILAGGSEGSMTPLGFGGFMNMKATTRGRDPGASRPFDLQRDGFVMSEGSGLIVLEELVHARARGARIYAELVGYGSTTDAHHITAPAPGGEGAARCMRAAIAAAGLVPADVEYVNAHGTSTPLNDRTETQAIRSAFGAHADKLQVSSTKGVTGHLLGAAGGVEAIATVMALYTGIVPPTAHYATPDPDCDLDYVPNVARESRPRVALSNGFGFGGTNAVLAFRRWEDE